MKFSGKLTKLRKENGLSQEDLADKLDVSRQSVSKWELGTTYPEMDKLLTMCKIFNVTLDDLTNDEVDFKEVKSKKNYFDSFMDDITGIIDNSYKMFKNMSSKNIGKTLVELFIIFLVLLACKIPFAIIIDEGSNVIRTLPHAGIFLSNLWSCLINLAYVALFIFTFLYIYKSQFLDKYKYEENINEEKNESDKEEVKVEKETVIKESKNNSTSGALFKTLKAIVTIFFKIFLLTLFVPSICAFVALFVAFFVMLYLILNGVLYFGVLIAIIGAISLCGLFIRMLFCGISDSEMNLSVVFITGIAGLVMFGCGIGLSTIEISNTKFINSIPTESVDLYTKSIEFKPEDNLVITDYRYDASNTVIDESLTDKIVLEISYYNRLVDMEVNTIKFKDYTKVDLYADSLFTKEAFRIMIDGLKDRKLYNPSELYDYTITIKSSKANIDRINQNISKYYGEDFEYRREQEIISNEISTLENRINALENDNSLLREENETLKSKIESYKESINNL